MLHSLVAITYEASPAIGQCEARYIGRQPIDFATALEQHRCYVERPAELGSFPMTGAIWQSARGGFR